MTLVVVQVEILFKRFSVMWEKERFKVDEHCHRDPVFVNVVLDTRIDGFSGACDVL